MKLFNATTAFALTLAAAAAGCSSESKTEAPASDTSPGTMTPTTKPVTTMAPAKSAPATPAAPAATATAAIAEKDMTHVVSDDEPYFASMPSPGKRSDGTLKAGTKVVVLMPRGGYSQVMTADGKRIYTTTAALKPVGS